MRYPSCAPAQGIAVFLAVFLAVLWTPSSLGQETWNLTTVSDVDSGLVIHYSDTSIATDSTGGVHISYRDPSAYLAYATNSTGSWQTATLLVDWPGTGRENAIVLDADEQPQISSSFSDGNDEDLYHVYLDGTDTWQSDPVSTAGSVGMENAIALDGIGAVHISHRYWNSSSLYYSTNHSGSWVTTDLGGASWDRTAIVIDGSDGYHIVYRNAGQLLHRDSAATTTVIASVVDADSGPSVAIDSGGDLHVSYGDGVALKYATEASGSWVSETVDSDADPARHHSIAVDTAGKVHISYRDEILDALLYADNTGGSWASQVVDDTGDDTGYSNAIAVDPDGAVHISYRRHSLDPPSVQRLPASQPMILTDAGWRALSAAELGYATTDQCRGDDATGDSDSDGICDDLDLCRGDDLSGDTDMDEDCDDVDNCPTIYNPDQADQDGDGIGDVCDIDTDGDGHNDDDDNCPLDANADQADLDEDGLGDVCDDDDDGDGVDDVDDNCPLDANADQADLDGDDLGDVCDPDADADGHDNDVDNCPLVANGDQADQDGDGLGDLCDLCDAAPISDPATSAQGSIDFLAAMMDEYHDVFPVYDDVSSAGSHFIAYGKIPDSMAAVSSNGSWVDPDPARDATVIRSEFNDNPDVANDGGYYFLNGTLTGSQLRPTPNFGTEPDAGIDLSGATLLTFSVKGEAGGEEIDFFFAGVGRDAEDCTALKDHPGSECRHPALGDGYVPLTTDWQQVEINIPNDLDLSYVLGGFAWHADDVRNPGGAVFYIDNIYFTLSAAAQTARLDLPRFLRSYETLAVQPTVLPDPDADDDIDFVVRNLAFSYDNALVLLAFLADGSADSLRRAELIGDAFVYASLNDRFFSDGRIRTAYAAGDLILPPGWTPNGIAGTVAIPGFYWEPDDEFFEVEQDHVDVGNNSWVMIALLALHDATGEASYLDAARRIGDFIRTFKNDTATYQGFQGGIEEPEDPAMETLRPWASGEHNLDIFAAFSRLAELDGDPSWLPDAAHAQTFLDSLWDPVRGCYYAGTDDPETRNEDYDQLPLDVQTWSVLALPGVPARHSELLACIESHHRASDEGFTGYDFNTDQDGVWFEGTGQSALAYRLAGRPSLAEPIENELRCTQTTSPFGDGSAIVATTRDGLTTGFDFEYFRRHHIATAAWNVFAQLGFNPYYTCLGVKEWVLSGETVDTTAGYQACDTITAGDGYQVLAPGDLTLRAGNRVQLTSGFSVGSGAALKVEIAAPE